MNKDKFSQSFQILGRMMGLDEVWGHDWEKIPIDLISDRKSRMSELCFCLTPPFVVWLFTKGLPSDRVFLENMIVKLYS